MQLKNAGTGATALKPRKETLAGRDSNPPPSEKRQKRSSTTRKPDLGKLDLPQGQSDDLTAALEEVKVDLDEEDTADGAIHMHIDSIEDDSDDESDFAGEEADGLGSLDLATIEVNSRPLKLRDLDGGDDAAILAEKIPRKLTFGSTINQLFVDECEDHR